MQHLLHIGADIDYRDGQDLTALHHAVLSGFEDVAELLLSRGADVNAPSATAGLPLCLAVLKDRSNLVSLLLGKFRAAINLADNELGTPLHCAAFTGNWEIANALLEHGAAPDPANRVNLPKLLPFQGSVSIGTPGTQSSWSGDMCWTEITPLMIAVLANNFDVAALLFESTGIKRASAFVSGDIECTSFYPLHAVARWGSSRMAPLAIAHSTDVDLRDASEKTPLIWTVEERNSNCVRWLLEAKASPDLRDSNGDTALILASYYGYDECVMDLINAGASLDIPDKENKTALICASSNGYGDCVRQLIETGASLDNIDESGETALTAASICGSDDCVKQLIEAGASVDLYAGDGATALLAASVCGHDTCVERLIRAGASLETKPNALGSSLLHDVVIAGQTNCAQVLCDHGADTNARCLNGSTPLHGAAANDQLECLLVLLEHQGDPNLASEQGFTPLMAAARTAKPLSAAIVEALLHAGADVAARTHKGDTALHMAARHDRTDVAELLLDAGASTAGVNNSNERPLDGAKLDSAMYSLLLAWDTGHTPEAPMRRETQIESETQTGCEMQARRQTEKLKTSRRKGWTRRSRGMNGPGKIWI